MLIHLGRRRRPGASVAGSTLREFEANVCYQTRRMRRLSDGLRVVHEEQVAWERGYRLGRRLRLGIDKKTYRRHAVRNAMTYVRWLGLAPVS